MNVMNQIISFQKTTSDNILGTISILQDHAEKVTNMFLMSSTCPLPDEGKKFLNEWIQSLKKGRDDFKKIMDGNFKRVEEFFAKENPKSG